MLEKSEQSLRNLWDNFRSANTWTNGIPEGEDRENGAEKISEIMAENPPNMVKYINIRDLSSLTNSKTR